MSDSKAHIIVFGNEENGSGKSTAAIHTAVALMRLGYSVGTIDLDTEERALTQHVKNRWRYINDRQKKLPIPIHMDIQKSQRQTEAEREKEERNTLEMGLKELHMSKHFAVLDTPNGDAYLSRLAHRYADTLVTPLNDDFAALKTLADIDPETYAVTEPSDYTKMVEEMNIERIVNGGKPLHWIVMRNRIGLKKKTKNKKDMGKALQTMSEQLGFQYIDGFGERDIFEELFAKGLTLLDLKEDDDHKLTVSDIAARQEVRTLIHAIAPEKIKGPVKPPK